MAEHKLSILIEALGAAKANQSLKGVDKTISSIGSHASRGFKNAANNLKTIGVIAAGFVAANVYKGIESLEDLERVTNQTAAVIKSTGGVAGVTATQVRELSQSLEELTTVDDKAIQGGANLLLTFTGIGKETFPRATKAMVDMAIALAQGDVEAANFQTTAIQIGKALNDPVKGMTALRKSGVSFTAEQIKQVKTLVKSGKTLAAQEIILAELEKEFGKAGEAAAKGFGGDMRRFQDAVEDAQQALAIGFLPLIRDVATELSSKLKDPKTLERIRELGIGLAAGFRKLMDFAGRIPWGTIGDSLKTAGAGAKAIFDAFLGLPPWVQTAVISGWGLNKLTGGALGSIVGELGKGLIKGVLNTNAAVMNVRAGVVNGLGGAGGAAGAAAGSRFGVLAGFAKMIGLGAGIGIAAGSNAAGPGGQISGEGFLGNLGGGALAGASVAGPVGMFAGAMIGLVKSVSEVESGINTAMAQQAHANMQQGTGLAGASASELTTKLAAIDSGISRLQENPLFQFVSGDALAELEQMRAEVVAALKNSSGSPEDRDDTRNRLDAIKKTNDQNRIAVVAATRTGDREIVAAIRNIKISNPITIISSRTGTYVKTGTTLKRVGGAVAAENLW